MPWVVVYGIEVEIITLKCTACSRAVALRKLILYLKLGEKKYMLEYAYTGHYL